MELQVKSVADIVVSLFVLLSSEYDLYMLCLVEVHFGKSLESEYNEGKSLPVLNIVGESSPALKKAEKEHLHYCRQVNHYEGLLRRYRGEIKLQEKELEENRNIIHIIGEQLKQEKGLQENSVRMFIGKRFHLYIVTYF